MFVLASEPTFTHPVKIQIPVDGGKFNTHTIDCTFKVIDQDRIEEILKAALDIGTNADQALLVEVVTGWDKVQDEEKNDIPFNSETLGKMVRIPYVRTGMATTFFNAISGVKTKN